MQGNISSKVNLCNVSKSNFLFVGIFIEKNKQKRDINLIMFVCSTKNGGRGFYFLWAIHKNRGRIFGYFEPLFSLPGHLLNKTYVVKW